ncbi:DUF5317 domain-containing protein [Anaerofustis stercorihominis]|uniref:Uncharacterized protein n=1 Tax=Anaerofustis stercorihominis TaxID=214853 RepID=A0A3E3E241_9FIRM|nr:DUF5317 domain-containing protein [Anaerofustis stercorihominis]RGD75533.1 hypothetical protein DW687_04190 [Anaerofustis stercorihominis]
MFLLEIAIISIIVGLIRKGSIKNFFIGGLRGWYIFLVAIVLFMSQKVLALAGVTALNDYAFWITIAAYILLFVGLFLNLEGIWAYGLLIGALMNFVIIVLNGGLMPVSETALATAGLGNAVGAYMTKFGSTMAVATDSTIFLWKYLGAIIPLPLPSILGEVLTPGTIVMGIASFGFIQSIMTTQYMDEDEYERYMSELSSEDKKDIPLLDDALEAKKEAKGKDDISDDDLDYTANISDETKELLEPSNDDHTFDDLKDDALQNTNEDLGDDFFADFELDDLNEQDMNEEAEEAINEEELSELEEEGSKLEDEDLLKELEDEFNENEEELFNEDESLDELMDDAFSEDEFESEDEDESFDSLLDDAFGEEAEEIPQTEEAEPMEDIADSDDNLFGDIAPIAGAAGLAAAGLAMADNKNNEKEPDLEELLNEALGDDEDDEDINELLNELRNLSNEDDDVKSIMDTDNTEELTLDEDDNEDSGIDYDFFKDEEENISEVETVQAEDYDKIEAYKEEDTSNIITKEDEDLLDNEPSISSSENIKDAKEMLRRVGTPKVKASDPVNPMPDVDVDSPFIITDGRIVENPYYKFKKGTSSRREEALSSPQIDDNGIYVMSGGGLAKVKGDKVEPQIPKDTPRKTPVRKSNIPNLTSTPSFIDKAKEEIVEDKQEFEQFRPEPQATFTRREEPQKETSRRDMYSQSVINTPSQREPSMTIVNDSSTGRTISTNRDSYNYPKEQVLRTTREPVLDESGREVPNPYEKVEMKIGDVEIKFWKKDNQ